MARSFAAFHHSRNPIRRVGQHQIHLGQVLKNIAIELAACNRLHGAMTKITSATMKGDSLEIKGDINGGVIDNYPMKPAPTPEQLKSLKGQPVCDPN